MKAFKIHWAATTRKTSIELETSYNLPQIQCDGCGQTWGNDLAIYPAFRFEFLNKEQFHYERIVSVAEFNLLKIRIESEIRRSVNLVPGGGIGPLTGEAFLPLEDFAWGTLCVPQISRRGLELLGQEGISLPITDCKIKFRRRIIDTHVALHLEPLEIMESKHLEMLGYIHCSICGDYNPPLPTHGKGGRESVGLRIEGSRWPRDQHLVFSLETFDVFASSDFMAAVRKHRLGGIQFLECGEYV